MCRALASRILLLFVALAAGVLAHHSLTSELGRWDGTWYGQIASGGYPRHTSHYPTTLGFFPLYPLTIWFVVHLPGPPNSVIIAGVLISLCGGLAAGGGGAGGGGAGWGGGRGRPGRGRFLVFARGLGF